MRRNVKRPNLLALTLLGHLAMPGVAFAAQTSLESATQAAGLALKTATINVNGASIYYRDIGGGDQVVVLLHGYPESGDAFASAVGELGKTFRLIVPDTRGFGKSQPTPVGYDKRTVATDIRDLLDKLGIDRAHIVGFDLGARVAFSFALQYPQRTQSLTAAEAFIEGLAGTEQFKQFAQSNPRTQHFAQYAKVDESVARYQGKEQELILAFMNSRTKSRQFTVDDVPLYVSALKREGALRAAFKYYEAFDEDAAFVAGVDKSGLRDIPALAAGCEGPGSDTLYRQFTAAGMKHVKRAILKGCEHWVFEENPTETTPILVEFLLQQSGSTAERPAPSKSQ